MHLQFFIHYCNNNLKYDRLIKAKYIHFVQMPIQFGEIYFPFLTQLGTYFTIL